MMRYDLLILLLICLTMGKVADAHDLPAKRIITLAPNLARLVLVAGAGNRLVGVSAWSELPQNNTARIIGDSEHIDAERILALRPDLILAWSGGTPTNTIKRLKKLGLNIVSIHTQKLEDIGPAIREIGKLAGTEVTANKAAEQFESHLNRLRKMQATRKPVTVFIDIWDDPLMTVNGASFMSEALEVCNGHNIYGNSRLSTPQVSLESLIDMDPDVIVTFSSQSKLVWLNRQLPEAARQGKIFVLNANDFTQATPSIIHGIETLCKDLDTARKATGK
ncbi:MAG: ABC transporter substrate-binding protein [Pseudomonadota bacterium]|nr:ABC transporter substrate-binding protein [Pseudomonadota bacterium]